MTWGGQMDARTWELFLAFVGSGAVVSLFVWMITKIRKAGTDEASFTAQCEEVKAMKGHQAEQDMAIRALEKRMEEIDHSIDVRLTAIEVAVVNIKQLQLVQNDSLNATSRDIRDLLCTMKRE